MDDIDRKLLELLQEDATCSIAVLAEHVGLSSTPCWKRVQKLEASGVIARRVALLDPDRIGLGLTVFVAVEAYDHTGTWTEEFVTSVSRMPEVMELYRMAGDVDYMLRVVVADMPAYDAFYKRLVAATPLKNVTSRFAMERVKHTTAYPLARPDARAGRWPAGPDARSIDADDRPRMVAARAQNGVNGSHESHRLAPMQLGSATDGWKP